MKEMHKIIIAITTALFALPFLGLSQDSSKKELMVNVSYYMNSDKAIYVLTNAKTKVAKKFIPVSGININVFLDNDSFLIARLTTDKEGLGKAILPPSLKNAWNQLAKHSFKAVSEATKEFDATDAEISVTKSRIIIDTLSDGDVKSINVKVSMFNGTAWIAVPDVEMKVGISRSSGAILSAGDEATYTTDSSGTVIAEFKKTNLPGDEKGNIILTAKVEENEQLGNLVAEKIVPWGVAVKTDNSFFNQRTLWSTRFRTPLWLLFMAYTIVIGVWATIIYLILQIIKIKKLGLNGAVTRS
jgi:type III secretion system FlhB-like substrate exporter